MGKWIGVDFHRTLTKYKHGDPFTGGEPIPAMVARVRRWLHEGRDVRIFTACITKPGADLPAITQGIQEWCERHLGRVLPITATKDWECLEIWDDRAIQVQPNTGELIGRPDAVIGGVK